jgi:hypothetical protein
MIKHALVGIFAAFVAIVIVAVAQPKESPALSLGPPVVKIDNLESFIPKRDESRRAPATRPANPLDKTIPEVNFNNARIADTLDFLRDVTGANLLVNWRALEAAGIERKTPVTVQLRNATAHAVLSAILQSAGGDNVPLRYWYHKGILNVSTADYLIAETEIRLYNVRDLMIEALRFHRSFDHAVRSALPTTRAEPSEIVWTEEALSGSLRDLIMTCTDPDSWVDNGGGFGFCHYWAGKVLIVQTPEAHDEIERFLNMLREE